MTSFPGKLMITQTILTGHDSHHHRYTWNNSFSLNESATVSSLINLGYISKWNPKIIIVKSAGVRSRAGTRGNNNPSKVESRNWNKFRMSGKHEGQKRLGLKVTKAQRNKQTNDRLTHSAGKHYRATNQDWNTGKDTWPSRNTYKCMMLALMIMSLSVAATSDLQLWGSQKWICAAFHGNKLFKYYYIKLHLAQWVFFLNLCYGSCWFRGNANSQPFLLLIQMSHEAGSEAWIGFRWPLLRARCNT